MSKSAVVENIPGQWEIRKIDFEKGEKLRGIFTASLNRQTVSMEALNFNKNA